MPDRVLLVVEDDENDVFFLLSALKRAGILISVHVAPDGLQALNYLDGAGPFANRAEFPLPMLILLDLKLPHVMGLDVLRWIRKRPELSMPVIILSASRNESDIEQAYRSGANAYLVKPNAVATLTEMCRAIKDFWLVYNQLPHQILRTVLPKAPA